MEKQAKRLVLIQAIKILKDETLTLNDIKVVWESKTLQNWKGIFVIPQDPSNELLYEVTYDGDKQTYYLDIYKKIDKLICEVV